MHANEPPAPAGAPAPTIIHVDLDAFYASVEQRDHIELRGKPVVVGGSIARGVVAAASYEVRRFGVHSAMPMAEALRRCPHAIVIAPRMAVYAAVSRQFFAILERYSPTVEPLSLDEAFLDLTGSQRLLGSTEHVARSIKRCVREELGLIVSVGTAPSKFVAKIASDIDKPDGLCLVTPDQVLSFLHPLPVSRLWGVGRVTKRILSSLGLETIGDVARYPEDLLQGRLGQKMGAHLAALARGHDPRAVKPDRKAVSIGHEETFAVDFETHADIEPVLLAQADRVAARLRYAGLRASVVQLKVKYADFRIVTRRRTLGSSTADGNVIGAIASTLLADLPVDGHHGKRHRVRLCGVSTAGLTPQSEPRQLSLDLAPMTDGEVTGNATHGGPMSERARNRGERLGHTLDRIQSRFGQNSIKRAVHVDAPPPTSDTETTAEGKD